MAMQDDKSDLFIFDGLFEDKTIDDFFNFSVEDVEEDPTDQLLVMKDPSPAYLSWAAEAQALIANFPPPPPSQPQQQQHQSLMTTVNGDDDTFAAAAVDDFTAKPNDVASFACEDDPELAWFSNFVDDSYSPADAAAPACVDIPSDAATNYSGITAPFQFRAGTTHSTVTNPVVLKEYNDVDEQDFDHHALLCRAARYRTPSPVSVLDRTSAAQGLLGGGTGSQLIIEVPNPKVVHTATSSASTYSSSSSSSPTSSSCSGVVVSGLKMHGPRSPPESFAHVRGRAPRTKRSRPTARPEALLPIVAPPLPSHFASIPADDESQHLLPMPDSSPAPIYIPVPKMSSPSTESTTTTASLPPIDSTLPEDNDNTSSVDCCAPKKKKIKLTITSSAAAAAAAAAPMMHHPATDASGARKCMHCGIQKTPQWRAGPMGPKTLCNACGVRYKSGRLFPEYRPAASPTFVASIHSNSHKKVVEMRNKTTTTTKTGAPAGAPVSSKGCELLNYIRGAAKALPPPPVAAATATAGGSSSDRDW